MGKIGGNTSTTLISRNTEVVGDVHFTGTLHVEGIVRGNVIAKDGGDAHLDVLEHGMIQGEISVPTARIDGKIVGNVHASKHVELASKAKVEGNVHYNLIEMVKGSQVNGSLIYIGEAAKPKKANLTDASSPSPSVKSA